MLPANGLQYVPPHPCKCYIDEKFSGFYALAPADGTGSQARPAGEGRLRRGNVKATETVEPRPEDWPAFRGDNLRSGAAVSEVPLPLREGWSVKPGRKISPPIAAEDKVFVSLVDEHHVVALDARDGKEIWAVAAGARIDSPPAYWKGRVFFGSADGRVYSLRAADGELAWRFDAAPAERLIGSFSQLESAWPVHGSVVVLDGRVYFVAGHSCYVDGGMTMYALDALTGAVVHARPLTDPGTDFSTGEAQFVYGSGPGVLNDILQANAETLFLRDRAYGLDLQPVQRAVLRIRPLGGFLDDSYFRRSHWTFGTGQGSGGPGRLIAHDDRTVYTLRMMDSLHALDPNNFFTPGKDGYTLIADRKGGLSCVKVANSNSLNPTKKPLTVEAWIKPASPDGVILGRGGVNAGYALLLKNGRPSFQVRINDIAHKVFATRKVADQWTHVAGVLTPEAQLQVWVDGQLAGTAKAPSLLPGSAGQPTEIGADLGTGAGEYESPNAFTGLIDEVRLYHRALSEKEIRQRASHPESPPEDTNHGVAAGVEPAAGKVGRALRFAGAGGTSWTIKIPIRGKAMVATEQTLFVAGPPDVLDEIDPLGAFEGRKGGKVWALSAATGERVAEVELDSPPVFNGMAVANQRLYLSTQDGRVTCFSGDAH
jgi:outer membrane protein assembly factor BamB